MKKLWLVCDKDHTSVQIKIWDQCLLHKAQKKRISLKAGRSNSLTAFWWKKKKGRDDCVCHVSPSLKNIRVTLHLHCHACTELTEILMKASGEFLKSLHTEQLSTAFLLFGPWFLMKLQSENQQPKPVSWILNLNITFVCAIRDEAELCFKIMKTVKFQRDLLVLRGQYWILNDNCSTLFLLISSSSLKKNAKNCRPKKN